MGVIKILSILAHSTGIMLQLKKVQSTLNKHKKRGSWFVDDYSVNPYEGCSCNCLYCYIRGSKYGENMNERLVVEANTLAIMEKQLHKTIRRRLYIDRWFNFI